MKRQDREIRYYKQPQRRGCSFANIANFVGFEETNLGRGCLYKKVVDHDGSLSKDLSAVP